MSAGEAARCAVLIPAHDEARRVGAVVVAAAAAGCGPVLVVDDGSSDGTADAATAAGADVLTLPRNVGKGGALAAGAARLDSEVVVLLDADLTGLTPAHVRALAEPVLRGEAAMTRGVFRGARWATTTAQRLAPQLGGQRALRRADLLALPGLAESRFGVEVLLSDAAHRQGWAWRDVPLHGVGQRMKEEKRGWWAGVRARAAMYRDIARSWWRSRR
jgi:glycosyltransferase involved in cell wall biosynthesis